MRLELVILDVAGTTVVASDDVARIIHESFQAFHMDVSPEAIAAVRGKSKNQAIRELLNGCSKQMGLRAGPDEIYREFRDRLIKSSQSWLPVPGATETIEWFKARKVKVALITGFDRAVLGGLLDRLGWNQGLADSALCSEDVLRGRPAPDLILHSMELCEVRDALRVAVVGDTKADLMAAQNAKAGWSIGVLTGAHSSAELARCPHSAILESVADLPAWCCRQVLP